MLPTINKCRNPRKCPQRCERFLVWSRFLGWVQIIESFAVYENDPETSIPNISVNIPEHAETWRMGRFGTDKTVAKPKVSMTALSSGLAHQPSPGRKGGNLRLGGAAGCCGTFVAGGGLRLRLRGELATDVASSSETPNFPHAFAS